MSHALFRSGTPGWIRLDPEGEYSAGLWLRQGTGRAFYVLPDRCRSIGVEYDPRIYEKALENQSSCVSSGRSSFVLANAEHYAVPSSVDRVYFFNPFSLELLQKVMARILDSYYEHPRSILLFFYYPSDSYLSYLTSVPEMAFF